MYNVKDIIRNKSNKVGKIVQVRDTAYHCLNMTVPFQEAIEGDDLDVKWYESQVEELKRKSQIKPCSTVHFNGKDLCIIDFHLGENGLYLQLENNAYMPVNAARLSNCNKGNHTTKKGPCKGCSEKKK